MFQLKALVSHYANIGHYFTDPRLKALFTFQNMYLGLSPFDAPATYSLLQYTELAGGVWYPMGGMYRVVKSLEEIAQKSGVRFIYNAPVERLTVDAGRIAGAELADGRTLHADLFVGNADLPYIYDRLLPASDEGKKLAEKKYTCSTIMFYWGVDKVYHQLGHHNVFLAGDYKASFDRIFTDHTLPAEPSFYVHAPARTDASAAPAGQDTLYVLVPVGHIDDAGHQDWDGLVARARSTVFERLSQEIDVHDLDQAIKFEKVLTPRDWQSIYNLEKGAAFGLSHNFAQVGYLRPQNRHRQYKNLFFAGASTHPGTGLPIVLLSARLTTERILKEMKQVHERPIDQSITLPTRG